MCSFFFFGCRTHTKQLHKERLQILNTLINHHTEGDSYVKGNRIAVYEESIEDISILLPKEKVMAAYLNSDSLTIPQEDLRVFQQQWKDYRSVQWREWGWDNEQLISREEFPEYYDYGVPPPGYQLPSIKTDILYYSVPLVGNNYSLVIRRLRTGKHSNVVLLIILKKKNGEWIEYSSKGLFTS